MRIRDAFKSREVCESEDIGEDRAIEPVPIGNGGTENEELWVYVRENQIRTVRLEERQIIILRFLTGIGITILGGVVTSVAVSIMLLLI